MNEPLPETDRLEYNRSLLRRIEVLENHVGYLWAGFIAILALIAWVTS